MAVYWHSEAVRRAGLTDDDLVSLSGNDTATVVAAWHESLTASVAQSADCASRLVEAIVRRHPQLFGRA